MHPVGPLPASTYWRRRLVLLGALVVLLLLVRSCAGGGAPRPAKATPSPRASVSTAPSAAPTPTPTPAATASPVAVPTCADADLTLTTSTDAASYPVGASPRITLVVKNTSARPCRRDLGGGPVELLVYSGPTDRIWSSDDCGATTGSAPTTLPAGGSRAVLATWPGTRSLPACAGSRAAAKAGTYRVVARVGSLTVNGAVFRLQG